MSDISEEVKKAVGELLDAHPYKKGSILVMGCSSSEIDGGLIGHNSNGETGRIVFLLPAKHAVCVGFFLRVSAASI